MENQEEAAAPQRVKVGLDLLKQKYKIQALIPNFSQTFYYNIFGG